MATEIVLRVEGMTCAGCEGNVEFALSSLPGVERVEADHEAKRVTVGFDPARPAKPPSATRSRTSGIGSSEASLVG